MADSTAPSEQQNGLRHVLIATAVAGAIGYLIQFLVPVFAPGSYLQFATAWSAIYLVVTGLSGIQQEITRAARGDASAPSTRTWLSFTGIAAMTATVAVVVLIGLSSARIFTSDAAAFTAVVATAAFGYTLVASFSGAAYGLKDWRAVASMTIADAVLRAAAIGLALLAGGAAVALGFAVAVPFIVAVALLWGWRGQRFMRTVALDVPLRRLIANSSATVLASLATGALISGLPLLLRAFASDAGEAMLSSLILVITLTRAPLVVPLLALQGYLVVSFRDRAQNVTSRVLKWAGLVLAAAMLLSVLAALLGPLIMSWLYRDFAVVSAWDFAWIVLSAGLTAVMCVTGPAVLAARRHAWYTAGWAISAVVSVGVLLLPVDPHTKIMTALILGPLSGAALHVAAVRAQRPAADPDHAAA